MTAVHDVSYGVDSGDVFGLLGPNGAGKTTTLSMVTNEIVRHAVGKRGERGKDKSYSGHKRGRVSWCGAERHF